MPQMPAGYGERDSRRLANRCSSAAAAAVADLYFCRSPCSSLVLSADGGPDQSARKNPGHAERQERTREVKVVSQA